MGDKNDEDTQKLLRCLHSKFIPNKIVILADSATGQEEAKGDAAQKHFLYEKLDILRTLERIDGKATAFVCENYACKLPVHTAEELEKLL